MRLATGLLAVLGVLALAAAADAGWTFSWSVGYHGRCASWLDVYRPLHRAYPVRHRGVSTVIVGRRAVVYRPYAYAWRSRTACGPSDHPAYRHAYVRYVRSAPYARRVYVTPRVRVDRVSVR